MLNQFRYRGYLLLQCAIAIFCVSLALSIIMTVHVHSLHLQHTVHSQAWATINAASARTIQRHYFEAQAAAWQLHLTKTLPGATSQIDWKPNGAMQLCWEGPVCWQLN